MSSLSEELEDAGGLAVGEKTEDMYRIIDAVEPYMPQEKPRYLMGVGTPSNIIEAVARRMKLPLEKFYLNLEPTGNTSAASIPIALDEAVRKGELKKDMKIVLCGFGAGLPYAGTYLQWPYL